MFLDETEAELKKVKRGTRIGAKKWPLKFLLKLLVDVATFSSSVDKGRRGPDWTVVTSSLVSVYRDEIAKKEVIDNYNMTQDAKPSSGPMLTAED